MDSDQGKLFIGGISWETTDDKLREHFSQFGEVAQTAVMRDKTTGRPRGFGFVVFSDPAILDVVLQNQHTIDGRTVEAKRALSREEQQTNPRSGFNNTDRSTGGTRTKKIFVGGLPSTLTEEEFRQYFETYGSVTDVVIMFDQNTQRPRGFGFISFEAESSVDRVLHKTYHDLNGKKVEVKRALPKDANNGGNRGMGGNSGFGGGSYQGYSGSAGSDSSYDGQMDTSRYMQPPGSGGAFPSYGSSGYGGAAYGYGPASSGMGYGGYSSYGGAPQGGGRGGPWGSQGPSGYGAMGYGNGAPGSAPSGQAPSGVAGYGSQGYGYGGYMGGADGGYGALGGRYGSSPGTAARGHGGVEMQGNNTGGYAASGYGDVNGNNSGNGNAAWRSDPSHAPGNYGSSGTYGGGYSGGQPQ